MPAPPRRHVAGAIRWWMPLLGLAAGTVLLVFAASLGGVDVGGAFERLHERFAENFHSSSRGWHNDAGYFELEFDSHDHVKAATHDGRPVPLTDLVFEGDCVTVSSLAWPDGEPKFWRLPITDEGEARESLRNPRWRLLTRVRPRGEGEPAGLRVSRIGAEGVGARCGLQAGDVIVRVDGRAPPTSAGLEEALQHALAERAPGGELPLVVQREGEELALMIELDSMVRRSDWEASTIEDPVERYLDIWSGGSRRTRRGPQPTIEVRQGRADRSRR